MDAVREKYPEVRIIASQRNLGFAKANNIGIRASSGKYLALINPDVIVLPGCMEAALSALASDDTIGLVGPMMLAPDGSTSRSGMRLPTLWNALCDALVLHRAFGSSPLFGGQLMHDFDWATRRDVEVLNGWFWLMRGETVAQVGSLDEDFFMYGEDVDWCKRFRDDGWRVVFEPAAVAIHFGGGSSANAPVRFFIELQRSNLTYWDKHSGRLSRTVYRAILVTHHLLRAVAYGAKAAALRSSTDARYKCFLSAKCLTWLLVGTRRDEDAV